MREDDNLYYYLKKVWKEKGTRYHENPFSFNRHCFSFHSFFSFYIWFFLFIFVFLS